MKPASSPLLAAAALVAGCPGGGERPLRIGVIVDCTGIYRSLEDAELSGAALPLIERGARLRGRRAADGITPATVAGRQVELVRGCTETYEFSTLTSELRWLAEREGVDAIVAAANGPEQVILREVAGAIPTLAFVAVGHGAREVTLQPPGAQPLPLRGRPRPGRRRAGRPRLPATRLAAGGGRRGELGRGLGRAATRSPRSSARSAARSPGRWS